MFYVLCFSLPPNDCKRKRNTIHCSFTMSLFFPVRTTKTYSIFSPFPLKSKDDSMTDRLSSWIKECDSLEKDSFHAFPFSFKDLCGEERALKEMFATFGTQTGQFISATHLKKFNLRPNTLPLGIFVLRGALQVNQEILWQGDLMLMSGCAEQLLEIIPKCDSYVLIFPLLVLGNVATWAKHSEIWKDVCQSLRAEWTTLYEQHELILTEKDVLNICNALYSSSSSRV